MFKKSKHIYEYYPYLTRMYYYKAQWINIICIASVKQYRNKNKKKTTKMTHSVSERENKRTSTIYIYIYIYRRK